MIPLTAQFPLDPDASALLVIDTQNDFLDQRGYFSQRGMNVGRLQQVIEPINALRKALPSKIRTIFTTQVFEPDGSDDTLQVHHLLPTRLLRSGGVGPVIRGSWGAEILPELRPRPDDLVISKRRFDAFYQTDLELLLRCWGVKTIIFAGVVADVCVETSLRSAYVRDFDVVVARECVAAWADEDMLSTVAAVQGHFGVCWTNAQIVNAFTRY
ncbi:MAG: cysteine hydrolase [Burkholderiales bacterium]|nr:cysteine hydrolase [Burkholderiales bacterium]